MGIPERWNRFRELPTNIGDALDRLVPLFENEGVLLAYVFGSLTQGRSAQDVDLALLTRDKPVFDLRDAITDCLATERVDLVDLRYVSPIVRFEVIRTGRLLYAIDDMTSERFELDVIHLYRDTRPLRCRQEGYLRERMTQWSCGQKPS